MQYDLIVIGAGASGLNCASVAAAMGKTVLVLDHAPKAGRKLRMSGGGKGNITNLQLGMEQYLGKNPHFTRSALARYSTQHMLQWLEQENILWEERDHGRIFCLKSAADILDALLNACRRHSCHFSMNRQCTQVQKQDSGLWQVTLENGQQSTAHNLLIATGSPAYPQVYATNWGATIAQEWGHSIVPFTPALAPLHMPPHWGLQALAGIAVPVHIALAGNKKTPQFTDSLLFTHQGISGPAALQISSYWEKNTALHIDFLPQIAWDALRKQNNAGKLNVKRLLTPYLPERLILALFAQKGAAKTDIRQENLLQKRSADLNKEEHAHITRCLHEHHIFPESTAGFRKAEAALGGISTADVASKSMESKLCPTLYFCGEVLDVTGQLGGYNLHWAFASGRAAGQAIGAQ